MGKTLELDGGKRVLRKQEGGRAHKGDEPLFHEIFPMPQCASPRMNLPAPAGPAYRWQP
jgi:hypothetical protein